MTGLASHFELLSYFLLRNLARSEGGTSKSSSSSFLPMRSQIFSFGAAVKSLWNSLVEVVE